MDLMFVIAAAVVAWVAGALWYRLLAGPRTRLSGVQADNTGHPTGKSALPYLLHGACLLVVASTMRALFLHGGIDTAGAGLVVGATLGTLVVTPILVMNDIQPHRPLVLTLIDGGHAVLVCALMGTILAAI